MSTKRLTALIPAHNDDYILSFALAAAAPHFDVLVLDDASTDATAQVVSDAFRERWPNVRAVPSLTPHASPLAPQLGWIEARNRLLNATDSDWLFFLDSDDVLAEYNAPMLREIAEASEEGGPAVVRLQLTELWGDFAHTTGRLRHYDPCHVFVNRSKVCELKWTGGTAAKLSCLTADGWRPTAGRSSGPLLFHCKGVKPDRRLVERQFVRNWLGAGRPGRLEDWPRLRNLSADEVHLMAMRMLFASKGDPCRPYPADGPPLPAVLREARPRFEIVEVPWDSGADFGGKGPWKHGVAPTDRLDHMPNWPEGA